MNVHLYMPQNAAGGKKFPDSLEYQNKINWLALRPRLPMWADVSGPGC
jgi:hypothetical protein